MQNPLGLLRQLRPTLITRFCCTSRMNICVLPLLLFLDLSHSRVSLGTDATVFDLLEPDFWQPAAIDYKENLMFNFVLH